MSLRCALLLLALAASGSACQRRVEPAPTTPIPTRVESSAQVEQAVMVTRPDPAGGPCPAALAHGELTVDGEHVALRTPSRTYVVIWPRGYTLEEDGEALLVTDATALRLARIGDTVGLGGGETTSPSGTRAWHACGDVSVVEPGTP